MSDSPPPTDYPWATYICPDGHKYIDGDIASIIRLPSITLFNEPIIRAECPGFLGAKSEGMGPNEWLILPIEGDPAVFSIGPQSQVWRWCYARGEIMKAHALQMHRMAEVGGGV